MPVSSRLSGSVRLSRPVPPGNRVVEEGLEVRGHVGVGGGEHVADLVVDGLDDLAQLPARLLHVLQLALQELVALLELLELLEGERVDRPHQAQVPLQLAGPAGGRVPLGQRRALGGHGPIGLAVELDAGASRPRSRGARRSRPRDLLPLGALAHLGESALGLAPLPAEAVETGGDAPHGLGLLAPALSRRPSRTWSISADRASTSAVEPVDGGGPGVDLGPAALGVLPLVGVLGQPRLDLRQALLGHPPALAAGRPADLEVGARASQLSRPLLDRPPEQAAAPGPRPWPRPRRPPASASPTPARSPGPAPGPAGRRPRPGGR